MAIAHLLFSAWCLFNAFFDAYLIFEDKRIAHGVNGALSVAVAWVISFMTEMNLSETMLFGLACLFNRQISFDIPLNLRRKLGAFYQSVANPPKAITDQIERYLFGFISGKQLAIIYFNLFLVSVTAHLLVFYLN